MLLLEVTLVFSIWHGQVDWIESHNGNPAVGGYVNVFLERLKLRKKGNTEVVTLSQAEDLGRIRRKEQAGSTPASISLCLQIEDRITSCFLLPLPMPSSMMDSPLQL